MTRGKAKALFPYDHIMIARYNTAFLKSGQKVISSPLMIIYDQPIQMWLVHAEGGTSFTKGAYSLGKVVWGKGWEELLKLLDYCQNTASPCPAVAIDCFGDGEARRTVSISPSLAFPRSLLWEEGKLHCDQIPWDTRQNSFWSCELWVPLESIPKCHPTSQRRLLCRLRVRQ